jgi:hypothetical protein
MVKEDKGGRKRAVEIRVPGQQSASGQQGGQPSYAGQQADAAGQLPYSSPDWFNQPDKLMPEWLTGALGNLSNASHSYHMSSKLWEDAQQKFIYKLFSGLQEEEKRIRDEAMAEARKSIDAMIAANRSLIEQINHEREEIEAKKAYFEEEFIPKYFEEHAAPLMEKIVGQQLDEKLKPVLTQYEKAKTAYDAAKGEYDKRAEKAAEAKAEYEKQATALIKKVDEFGIKLEGILSAKIKAALDEFAKTTLTERLGGFTAFYEAKFKSDEERLKKVEDDSASKSELGELRTLVQSAKQAYDAAKASEAAKEDAAKELTSKVDALETRLDGIKGEFIDAVKKTGQEILSQAKGLVSGAAPKAAGEIDDAAIRVAVISYLDDHPEVISEYLKAQGQQTAQQPETHAPKKPRGKKAPAPDLSAKPETPAAEMNLSDAFKGAPQKPDVHKGAPSAVTHYLTEKKGPAEKQDGDNGDSNPFGDREVPEEEMRKFKRLLEGDKGEKAP